MSKRNIAKISVFVISILCAALLLAVCGYVWPSGRPTSDVDRARSPYSVPETAGRVESPDIKESSGLAASKCQPGVLWTHNDSGDDAFVYAIDAKGENLGTWRVTGAENRDWEDVAEFKDASGQCYLYIGETGNNDLDEQRAVVYRVKEPAVTEAARGSTRKNPLQTEPAESVRVVYPGTRENAETLMVHPKSGDIYIVSKRFEGPATVYKVPPQFGAERDVTAGKIAEISVPSVPNGLLTGGDISPDGTRVALCDYAAGYELTLPAGDTNFDDIWKQQPMRFDLGERKVGESVAYSPDGTEIFAGSEGKNSPIFVLRRK